MLRYGIYLYILKRRIDQLFSNNYGRSYGSQNFKKLPISLCDKNAAFYHSGILVAIVDSDHRAVLFEKTNSGPSNEGYGFS
jgi:hypothetical protein